MNITPISVGKNFESLFTIILVNIKSSPIAFGSGGRPRLAPANNNQRVGNIKNIVFSPRLAERLRVPVRS